MTVTVLLTAAVLLVALLAYLVRAQTRRTPRLGVSPTISRRYTGHAKERMVERGVSRAQIEATLISPDRRRSDPREGSIRFEKDFDDAVLKVWVAADPWPPTTEVVIKSTAWKYFQMFDIPVDTVGRVKGRQGATVREIEASTGTVISVSREGAVVIRAGERLPVARARSRIDEIVAKASLRVGQRHVGTVVDIADGGVRVSLPHNCEGFVPVVNLRPLVGGKRINDIRAVITLNQCLEVEIQAIRNGQPRLVALAANGR